MAVLPFSQLALIGLSGGDIVLVVYVSTKTCVAPICIAELIMIGWESEVEVKCNRLIRRGFVSWESCR